MSPKFIGNAQKRDKQLQKLVKAKPEKYGTKIIENVELITSDTKIVVPTQIKEQIIAWCPMLRVLRKQLK